MTTKTETAAALFGEGHLCSQAVLAAFAPELGLGRETALKLGAAFGGGIARTGRTCGAVTGALMVIGLRHASPNPEDHERRLFVYNLARDFIARFTAIHGGIECRELLGLDLSDPEQYQRAKDSELFLKTCPTLVRTAAEIIEDI